MAHDGYAIGIDLGTSNTVAVLRWPDGRTRPLLFDGEPILPSGVYLDDAGLLHVGRDAQRMAQLDPARFEPNPKRRIDEAIVLLGDREGPVVGLLSVILKRVADKATEACGGLPSAVLTFPASWGATRRGILREAAGQAGWSQVALVPEPVAAARYFSGTLRHPVPEGGCLAVFDFGSGTLDVAVVRNTGGVFDVVGSGGAEDLGGLDLDAALVGHLGALLSAEHPQTWQRLSSPATPLDRRYRRLFWEDVRGAKEMLSRAAAAPVPVPGVDHALHLTREELEGVVRPLLERAVTETGAVIEACGLAPGQLTGVFLVGGTSRIPLVARMLHARLGVAPTALEQPELPVAEGALAELTPAERTTVQLPVPVAVGTGGVAVSSGNQPVSPATPPPAEGGGSAAVSLLPESAPSQPLPPRRWYRRPWVYAGAGIAVTAVIAASLLWYFGRTELPFSPLTSVAAVSMADRQPIRADIEGDRAFLATYEESGTLHLTAVDLNTGKTQEISADTEESWEWFGAEEVGLIAYGHSGGTRTLHVYDPVSLEQVYETAVGTSSSWHFSVDDHTVVWVDPDTQKATWVDIAQQEEIATVDYGDAFYRVHNWSDEAVPATLTGNRIREGDYPDNRLITISDTGTLLVRDAQNRQERGSTTVDPIDSEDRSIAYQGFFLIAGTTDDEPGYQVNAYDLDKLGEPKLVYADDREDVVPERLTPCGESYVCVLTSESELVLVDFKSAGKVWDKQLAEPDQVAAILPIGDRIMVNYQQGETIWNVLFDTAGNSVVRSAGWGAPIDSGSELRFDPLVASVSGGQVNVTDNVVSLRLTGVGAQSGEETFIGSLDANPKTCGWNHRFIACAGTADFLVYSFRDV